MQLGKASQDAMNDQIQKEMASAYLYLAMSSYLTAANYDGAASWMRIQAREEVGHALKFITFVEDRGGRVLLKGLAEPPAEFPSVLAVFEAATEHEAIVSASIHRLFELSAKEKDWAAQALLQWFITEQVEEEKTSKRIVDTLRLIGTNTSGLYMFDRELGRRGQEA
jgi:ferritin